MFAPPFWRWWVVYCVVMQLIPLLRWPHARFTATHMIFAIAVIPAVATVAVLGVRYLQAVRISPEGITVQLPPLRRTTIQFEKISGASCYRKFGSWHVELFVQETQYPRRGIPLYMGLPAFVAALERAGAADSNIGIACAAGVAAKRPPN